MAAVFYVEDDHDSIAAMKSFLPREHELILADSTEALADVRMTQPIGLAVLAHSAVSGCSNSVLRFIRDHLGSVPLILLGNGDFRSLYRLGMESGASEVMEKPMTPEKIRLMCTHIRSAHPSLLQARADDGELWGTSMAMVRLREKLASVSVTTCPVLLSGETGVGKEVAARFIHARSPRKNKPFVAINCGAIAHTLAESELFGVANGAYTQARERAGLLEAADGGTVLLDELGDLPPQQQALLLRFLQDGRLIRLGSTREIQVNVRVLAATNRDLIAMMHQCTFRADLYWRLHGHECRIPPLREHKEDIAGYVARFEEKIRCANPGASLRTFSQGALAVLCEYDWPGNIRQLEQVVAAMLQGGGHGPISADELESHLA